MPLMAKWEGIGNGLVSITHTSLLVSDGDKVVRFHTVFSGTDEICYGTDLVWRMAGGKKIKPAFKGHLRDGEKSTPVWEVVDVPPFRAEGDPKKLVFPSAWISYSEHVFPLAVRDDYEWEEIAPEVRVSTKKLKKYFGNAINWSAPLSSAVRAIIGRMRLEGGRVYFPATAFRFHRGAWIFVDFAGVPSLQVIDPTGKEGRFRYDVREPFRA